MKIYFEIIFKTPFVCILAWENLQFHKKLSIILSITDLYLMLFPGFNSNFYHKNLEIVLKKNQVFEILCLLFWSAHSKRKLSWNETITIRGTKPFYIIIKVISCKFCLIQSNTQQHLLTEDFVVELCSFWKLWFIFKIRPKRCGDVSHPSL